MFSGRGLIVGYGKSELQQPFLGFVIAAGLPRCHTLTVGELYLLYLSPRLVGRVPLSNDVKHSEGWSVALHE